MSLNIKVTPTENGAVITVNDYDISITVKPSEAAETPSPVPPTRVTVESVRSRLTEYLEELTIAEEAEGIVVRPMGYLGREKFASIAGIIRELGGSYISAGRESRFIIP